MVFDSNILFINYKKKRESKLNSKSKIVINYQIKKVNETSKNQASNSKH